MNKFIIDGNCTGKTHKMLEAAKESGATVVCKYPLHMQDKANCYGLYGLKFVSYEDFLNGNCNGEKVAIDEIGDFMMICFGVEIDSFTMTIDNKEVLNELSCV